MVMNTQKAEKDFLEDLKEVILYKKGSCSFYKKALVKAEDSKCVPVMRDMMKDETRQISKLEEQLVRYTSTSVANYDPEKHGGIVVPWKRILIRWSPWE